MKLTYDDEQVKLALAEIQHAYTRIAELKTIEDSVLQFIAGNTIRYFELKIRTIEKALWKVGLHNFVLKKDMEKSL